MTIPARPRATPREILSNDRVSITEWRLRPGEETGWRTRHRDCVVVYRTPARHILETRDGIHAVDVRDGQASFRTSAGEQNLINVGSHEVIFLETELK